MKNASSSRALDSSDTDVIDWDGPDDPENPLNWSSGRRITTVTIVSLLTLLSALSSSIFAPGLLQVLDEFDSDNSELGSFVVSIYVIGYGFGPLIIAPLSEIYGRSPLYYICNFIFVVFSAACALAPNLPSLLVFRLFTGLAGSCPISIGVGTIADVISYEKRGKAMAAWTFGSLIGPVIGPIAGGYLIEVKGWRWSFWVVSMLAALFLVMALFLLHETLGFAILNRKVRRLRKETNNSNIRSILSKESSSKTFLGTSIIRPSKMLICSPIIFLLSLYMFIVYGYFYLMFTALPPLFEKKYGFSTGSVGLTYLGLGAGSFAATLFSGAVSDRLARYLTTRAGGEPKPEYRLPLAVMASLIVPVGLFWIGWTAESHQHWFLPIVGTAILAFGITSAFMPIMTYLVDAFSEYAASAVAASILLRSLGGALLPLAGEPMFTKLGMGWGGSLLAFIAIVMIPVPIVFWKYGAISRQITFFNVKF